MRQPSQRSPQRQLLAQLPRIARASTSRKRKHQLPTQQSLAETNTNTHTEDAANSGSSTELQGQHRSSSKPVTVVGRPPTRHQQRTTNALGAHSQATDGSRPEITY